MNFVLIRGGMVCLTAGAIATAFASTAVAATFRVGTAPLLAQAAQASGSNAEPDVPTSAGPSTSTPEASVPNDEPLVAQPLPPGETDAAAAGIFGLESPKPESRRRRASKTAPAPALISPPDTTFRATANSERLIATGKVITPRRMYRDYVVHKGDHLDLIARDLQTTRAILMDANDLEKPNDLRPGQHLKVPVEKAYIAVAGDTLSAVAKRFDVSLADLADLNAMSPNERLHAGDQIGLPAEFRDQGPVAAPAAPIRSPRRQPGLPTYAYGHYGPSTGVGGSTWSPSSSPYAARPYQPTPSESAGNSAPLTDAQVTSAGRGRFIWPVRGEVLAKFGVAGGDRKNDGIDIGAPDGASVMAASGGEVVYAGDQVPGFGNLVLVKHPGGWATAYAHLASIEVRMRETVSQGQEIGRVGTTGGVSQPQLHFEIRYAPNPIEKAKPVDPTLVLPR